MSPPISYDGSRTPEITRRSDPKVSGGSSCHCSSAGSCIGSRRRTTRSPSPYCCFVKKSSAARPARSASRRTGGASRGAAEKLTPPSRSTPSSSGTHTTGPSSVSNADDLHVPEGATTDGRVHGQHLAHPAAHRHQHLLSVVDDVEGRSPDVEQRGGLRDQRGQLVRGGQPGVGQQPGEGVDLGVRHARMLGGGRHPGAGPPEVARKRSEDHDAMTGDQETGATVGPAPCDALLSTGDIVHLRPATAQDRVELLALHESLSPESLYLRFLSVGSQSARVYVDTLARPPTSGHLALVAVFQGRSVGVAGDERATDPDEAEIAMVVGDALHGRGIGTLLLEHLAHAARANGLRRLVATVLWENRRMLEVLACSGMRHSRTMNDGVVDVVIPLLVEEALLQAVDERERQAQVRSLERVLRPRTVAVVGASRRRGTVGRAVVHNLVTEDFAGAVYPVNPHADAVGGLPAYPSVRDLPRQVDLAVLAVPAHDVAQVMRECGEQAVHGVVVLASGFADTGTPGEAAQQQLVGLARAAGMRLIGPNCLGLLNTDPQVRLNATFAPTSPP